MSQPKSELELQTEFRDQILGELGRLAQEIDGIEGPDRVAVLEAKVTKLEAIQSTQERLLANQERITKLEIDAAGGVARFRMLEDRLLALTKKQKALNDSLARPTQLVRLEDNAAYLRRIQFDDGQGQSPQPD